MLKCNSNVCCCHISALVLTTVWYSIILWCSIFVCKAKFVYINTCTVKNYLVKMLIFYQIFIFIFWFQNVVSIAVCQIFWKCRSIWWKILHFIKEKPIKTFQFFNKHVYIFLNMHSIVMKIGMDNSKKHYNNVLYLQHN